MVKPMFEKSLFIVKPNTQYSPRLNVGWAYSFLYYYFTFFIFSTDFNIQFIFIYCMTDNLFKFFLQRDKLFQM